jgi:hypothetical protein
VNFGLTIQTNLPNAIGYYNFGQLLDVTIPCVNFDRGLNAHIRPAALRTEPENRRLNLGLNEWYNNHEATQNHLTKIPIISCILRNLSLVANTAGSLLRVLINYSVHISASSYDRWDALGGALSQGLP